MSDRCDGDVAGVVYGGWYMLENLCKCAKVDQYARNGATHIVGERRVRAIVRVVQRSALVCVFITIRWLLLLAKAILIEVWAHGPMWRWRRHSGVRLRSAVHAAGFDGSLVTGIGCRVVVMDQLIEALREQAIVRGARRRQRQRAWFHLGFDHLRFQQVSGCGHGSGCVRRLPLGWMRKALSGLLFPTAGCRDTLGKAAQVECSRSRTGEVFLAKTLFRRTS